MGGCKTSRKPMTHVIDTDVFYEILIRLALKDLVRCKAVSKEWLSSISNPEFWSRRMAVHSASGLFCSIGRLISGGGGDGGVKYVFIDFYNNKQKEASYMALKKSAHHLVILQSCNGLLLCSSMDISRREFEIHVYNPTTHRSRCIPLPPNQQHHKDPGAYPHNSPLLWSLAFDPRASSHPHHYKVICLSRNSQIQIYSSESGSWTAPALFSSPNHPEIWADGQWIGDWESSVFWNGCVHWIPHKSMNFYSDFLEKHKYVGYYFDVVEKRLCMMPALPFPPSLKEQLQGWWCYFGQSGDQQHLYLVWSDGCSYVYTVYEMERDYSGWSMRFRVDLAPVCIACIGRFARIVILCFVEVEDQCCLLLRLFRHKIIRYHLESQSFEQLDCSVAACRAFPFIESLAAV